MPWVSREGRQGLCLQHLALGQGGKEKDQRHSRYFDGGRKKAPGYVTYTILLSGSLPFPHQYPWLAHSKASGCAYLCPS